MSSDRTRARREGSAPTAGQGEPHRLYAWVWLPEATDPVVAGVLTATDNAYDRQAVVAFTYARSYRERNDAVSLFSPELPPHPGMRRTAEGAAT